MRKHIFTLMTLAAALCACNKEQMIESEVTNPEVEPSAPLVFTATMEDAPESKATFDNTVKCAVWEVEDLVVINGVGYEAKAAGTTTMFSKVEANQPREIRPVFVSTTTPDSYTHNNNSNPPSNLVDAAGTGTRWCAHKDHKVDDVWNIVVSTTQASKLKTIRLWNADNQSTFSNRRWKSIKVYGSASSQSGWTELKSIENLNLATNKYGFAGEVEINATKEYTFYKIDVLENEGDDYMQMSDMKFVVTIDRDMRPAFVSSTNTQSFENQPASNLVDAAGIDTKWIASKDHKVEGVWNVAVSTGNSSLLKTIKLWNADNKTNPGRCWKDIQLYGRASNNDAWRFINSFENLNLKESDYGLAGEIEINSSNAYTFYKIDVLDNEGDNYMQMSDMKFDVDPVAPYYAYFPASLYDGFTASLPSSVSETWAEGKFNMPMYAQSNTTNLEFKNLCGVLKITVKNETIASVKSIRISSSNKATSGTFTVVNNTAVLDSPNTTANTVTVTYTNAVTTSDEGTVFYVAIPAQTYQNLRIELSSDGVNYTKAITTTKNANIAVARNKIYSINYTDVVNNKGRGKAKATIDGQEVYVDWIQLWENGPKFAKFNIGAANNSETDFGNYYNYTTATTAISEWGDAWRMPTKAEFDGLLSKCEISKTSISSVSGWLFTGKGEYVNNSVFLPETGAYTATDTFFGTLYWSSSTYRGTMGAPYAYTLELDYLRTVGYIQFFQCPIRAVAK